MSARPLIRPVICSRMSGGRFERIRSLQTRPARANSRQLTKWSSIMNWLVSSQRATAGERSSAGIDAESRAELAGLILLEQDVSHQGIEVGLQVRGELRALDGFQDLVDRLGRRIQIGTLELELHRGLDGPREPLVIGGVGTRARRLGIAGPVGSGRPVLRGEAARRVSPTSPGRGGRRGKTSFQGSPRASKGTGGRRRPGASPTRSGRRRQVGSPEGQREERLVHGAEEDEGPVGEASGPRPCLDRPGSRPSSCGSSRHRRRLGLRHVSGQPIASDQAEPVRFPLAIDQDGCWPIERVEGLVPASEVGTIARAVSDRHQPGEPARAPHRVS